jgi:hypothetical protein
MQQYKFYATLLDSYSWFLQSEQDDAFQDFIDKINRKPYTSEAAEKGKAFNEIIDDKTLIKLVGNEVTYKTFEFKTSLINDFKAYFSHAASQVYTSTHLEVNNSLIELYGFADKVFQDTCFDIKTTAKYGFPKFIGSWQHKIYPFCFNQNGIKIEKFEYIITDFTNIFKEQYVYNPERDIPAIKNICSSLVDFVERHKTLITDRKIFGLQKLKVS